MTKKIGATQILTFEEWAKKPEVAKANAEITCDECGGTGNHECECGDTHTCGFCDGDGKSTNLREFYEQELRDEIERLRLWFTGEKIKTPSENLIPEGHETHAESYARISMPGKIENKKLIISVSKER